MTQKSQREKKLNVQRRSVGRPTKYREEYCEKIIQFFNRPKTKILTTVTTGKNDYEKVEEKEVAAPLPTLSGFALSINVNMDTLNQWCKVHPEFSESYKQAKELEAEFVVENAMRNLYAQPFSIFYMKNCHGWKDKQELTGADSGPLTIKIVNYSDEVK